MTVASVTEINAVSDQTFEEAIRTGINRATKTLRGVEGCWVKDTNVLIENGNTTGYKVNMEVTFVLEGDPKGVGCPKAQRARQGRLGGPFRWRNGPEAAGA
jgi:flavin-binding protein dodecin